MLRKIKLDKEIWKDIDGLDGRYQISNFGRVKSVKRLVNNGYSGRVVSEKILKTHVNRGYKRIILRKNGFKYHYSIHRLVAIYFIPNQKNKEQVNHKDGDKQNNHVNNLEWVDQSQNAKHALEHKLSPSIRARLDFEHGRLTEDEIKEIVFLLENTEYTQKSIAKKYKVCRTTISKINDGSHVDRLGDRIREKGVAHFSQI